MNKCLCSIQGIHSTQCLSHFCHAACTHRQMQQTDRVLIKLRGSIHLLLPVSCTCHPAQPAPLPALLSLPLVCCCDTEPPAHTHAHTHTHEFIVLNGNPIDANVNKNVLCVCKQTRMCSVSASRYARTWMCPGTQIAELHTYMCSLQVTNTSNFS